MQVTTAMKERSTRDATKAPVGASSAKFKDKAGWYVLYKWTERGVIHVGAPDSFYTSEPGAVVEEMSPEEICQLPDGERILTKYLARAALQAEIDEKAATYKRRTSEVEADYASRRQS